MTDDVTDQNFLASSSHPAIAGQAGNALGRYKRIFIKHAVVRQVRDLFYLVCALDGQGTRPRDGYDTSGSPSQGNLNRLDIKFCRQQWIVGVEGRSIEFGSVLTSTQVPDTDPTK